MNETIKQLIEKLINGIQRDCKRNSDAFPDIFAAYNLYQEEEENGAGYIFDINNVNDLKCVLDGGLTIKELHDLYEEASNYQTTKFVFGEYYPTPQIVGDPAARIYPMVRQLAICIVAYPNCEVYNKLYSRYITDSMLEECSNEHVSIRDFC